MAGSLERAPEVLETADGVEGDWCETDVAHNREVDGPGLQDIGEIGLVEASDGHGGEGRGLDDGAGLLRAERGIGDLFGRSGEDRADAGSDLSAAASHGAAPNPDVLPAISR